MSFKKNKKTKNFKNFLFKFLVLFFFGVCFWVLLFSDYMEIKNFKIETDKLDENLIKDAFTDLSKDSWLKYGSRNNFFLFPRQKLKEKLKKDFKIIKEVEFENKFPETLKVEIKERKALMIWCSQEKCFLLDEKGEVFYELKGNEKEERFQAYKIIFDKSFSETKEGEKIEDGKMVLFIEELREKISERTKLEIEREMETPSVVSSEIRLKTKNGWQIYFSLEQKIEEQLQLLSQILETEISKQEKENLNYIDLRIKGKAIYNSSIKQD